MCFPALIAGVGALFGGGGAAGAGAAAGGLSLGQVAGLAGSVVSGLGAIQGARAQSASLKAQAALNERQAELEKERGTFEATRERERAQRLLSRQRANFLASGVALEGTPTAVIEDTATETALDIAAIRFGTQIRANNFRDQAGIDRLNARSAARAGPIAAAGSLLSGITRLRSPYQLS